MYGLICSSISVKEKVYQEGHQPIFAFVRVLDGMQVQNEIEGISSVEDYIMTWVTITDHGGLYKINDKVLFVNKVS